VTPDRAPPRPSGACGAHPSEVAPRRLAPWGTSTPQLPAGSDDEGTVTRMKKTRGVIERALETFELIAGYGTKRRRRGRR
jgi:hypothetical protein